MKQRKVILLTSIGAGLEYYDFVIFALLAPYLSQVFFPHSDTALGLMKTFSVFAVGYLARPLGGVLFGHLGDRYGRKHAFLTALILMSSATLLMGSLPSYETIGYAAPVLLTLLRLLQGLALGAELPGAITFLAEHVNPKTRGRDCGFMMAGVGFGATFGAALLTILHALLTDETILAWAWRIPLWTGGLLAVMAYLIRRQLPETPIFLKQTTRRARLPLGQLIRDHWRRLLLGMGLCIFAASFIIFAIYLPTYLHLFYSYDLETVYLGVTLSLIWSSLMIPVFGIISDRWGRKRLLKTASLVTLLALTFIFKLLTLQSVAALYLFFFIHQTLTAVFAASYTPMLSEIFPTSVRYTGIAICYNIIFSLAGLTPLAINYLIRLTNNPQIVSVFFMALVSITLVSAIFVPYRKYQELE